MKKFYVNCNSPQRKFVWPGKMMKIFVLALVAACLSFSGRVMAQSQRVTLDLKSCSIIEFFRTLQEKTSLYFIYNIKDLQGLDKISVKADNEPVEEILRRIFAGRKLDFNFDNNTVVVQPRQMQNSRIKGRITELTMNLWRKFCAAFLPDGNWILTSTTIQWSYSPGRCRTAESKAVLPIPIKILCRA